MCWIDPPVTSMVPAEPHGALGVLDRQREHLRLVTGRRAVLEEDGSDP
jgi:hypothetical protein